MRLLVYNAATAACTIVTEDGPLANVVLQLFAYRVTVHPNRQYPLLVKPFSKPDVLRRAVIEHPTVQWQRGARWHIGNAKQIRPTDLSFRIGRVRTVRLPQTDENGNYVQTDSDVTPNTPVFLDVANEICVIASNTALSAKVDTIAAGLAHVLTASRAATEAVAVIEAAPIKEPNHFIARLQSAAVVRRLWVVNRRPNPVDAEVEFVRPTSRVLEELGGDQVKTEWKGADLKVREKPATDIIKSTAATAGDAGATVFEGPKLTKATIRLSGDRVSFSAEVELEGPDVSTDDASTALGLLRDTYRKIWPGR